MGSGTKKKGKITMGNYIPKDKERAAMIWCVHNSICISAFAKSTTEWYVIVSINGKINKSPVTYEKVEIWKQIYNYYLYYYSKYTKEEIKKEPKAVEQKVKKEKVINENLKLF